MLKQVSSALLASVLLYGCDTLRQSHDDREMSVYDSLLTRYQDFSGVILVARDGKPVYHKAFGYKTFADSIPMSVDAIFEWASVSKQFTAMIIIMLREEGRLDYDDPITDYIPELPYEGITIRHLLNHTSGLPDYQAIMDSHWDKSHVAGNEDNIAYLIKYHPQKHFEPGDRYEYSNTGYMLLATIAEKASGKDFIDLCRERIFTPLHMEHTDIRTRGERNSIANVASGHIYISDKNRYVHADSFPAFNYSIWLGNRKGPGRISGTASDLLKWDQALYTEKLVSTESMNEAYLPARLNNGELSPYGFGWMLFEHPGLGKLVMHTGDNPGYRTIILRFIDSRNTIIVFCNNQHPEFDTLVKSLGDEVAANRNEGPDETF